MKSKRFKPITSLLVALPVLATGVWVGLAYRDVRQQRLNSELFQAIEQNNLQELRHLLARGANPNADKPEFSDMGFLEKLLSKFRGQPLHKDDSYFLTALNLAAMRARPELVKTLLDFGADPNYGVDKGHSLLMWAFNIPTSERTEIGRMLLSHGAKPDDKSLGLPLVVLALREENASLLDAFLGAGADVNVPGQPEENVLSAAMQSRKPDIVRVAIKHGARVNDTDPDSMFSHLNNAVISGHTDVVKILVDNGADPNLSIRYECPPLANAVASRKADIVRLLLEYGANVTNQNPCLMGLLKEARDQNAGEEIIRLLRKAGAKE